MPDSDASFPEEHPNRPREYHGRRTLVVGVLIVAVVAAALWLGLREGGSPSIAGADGLASLPTYLNPDGSAIAAQPGSLAPDFELETLDGQRFRLSDWRGHPIVLNFWASWCSPCRREVPVLIRLQNEHRDTGLLIVGVNSEESRGAARGFADEFRMDYPIPMDFSGGVTRAYLQIGPPNSFFIGPDGVIQDIFVGQAPNDAFVREVSALIAGLPAALGPQMLAGPKALPRALHPAGHEARGEPGQAAPDFVLYPAGGSPTPWRLSDQRGTPLLLAFTPPTCADCEAPLPLATEHATAAGYRSVAIARGDPAGAPPTPTVQLDWRDDVAALYDAVQAPRFVLIDADGIVQAVVEPDQDLAGLLHALAESSAANSASSG